MTRPLQLYSHLRPLISITFLSKQEPLLLQQLLFRLLGSFCTILQLSSTEANKPFCLEKGKARTGRRSDLA